MLMELLETAHTCSVIILLVFDSLLAVVASSLFIAKMATNLSKVKNEYSKQEHAQFGIIIP